MGKESSGSRSTPDILVELVEGQAEFLGLPGNAILVIASYSMGYGFCATLANVRGYGPFGKDFLQDVAESLDLDSKHVVIRTVQGVVVYESFPKSKPSS